MSEKTVSTCGGLKMNKPDKAKLDKERELYREQSKRLITEQNKKKKKKENA